MKQQASVLFPAPELIGLLMDLNVAKGGFRHVSEFMTRRGAAYTAATGHSPAPSLHATGSWTHGKELVKPLALDRPVSVADPPTSGCSWPLQLWARYIQSRPPLLDTINWKRPLTFLLLGTQLSTGLLNHGARGRAPAYLWVIGMAVCGDRDMAALAIIWSQNSLVYGCCSLVLLFALVSRG